LSVDDPLDSILQMTFSEVDKQSEPEDAQTKLSEELFGGEPGSSPQPT
jgi:hypothetical protein